MGAPTSETFSEYGVAAFRQLTKDAFDQLDDPNQDLTTTKKTWLSKITNLTTPDLVDVIFQNKDIAIGDIKEKFRDYLAHSAKLISAVAIGETASYLGGPAGLAFGELANSFVSDAVDTFQKKKVDQNFKYARGDFVVVDLGKTKTTNKKILQEEALLSGDVFGDFDIDFAKDIEKDREDYSVGFYIGPSTEPAESMVFVFEHKAGNSIRNTHLTPMSAIMKKKYENSFEYTAVREIFLEKLEHPSLLEAIHKAVCPLEIGTEVIYQQQIYHIVKANELEAIIESLDGERLLVNITEIKPGRHNSTGVYIYSAEERREYFNPDFFKTGDFVWIPSDYENQRTISTTKIVLCVIGYFFGSNAVVYECFNGRKRDVKKSDLKAISDEFNDFVQKMKAYKLFQAEAVQNSTLITNFGVGEEYAHMCHGTVLGFGYSLFKENVSVTSQQTPGELPELEMTGQLGGTVAAAPQLLVSGGPRYSAETQGGFTEEEEDESKQAGYGMMVAVAAVVGIILITQVYKGSS